METARIKLKTVLTVIASIALIEAAAIFLTAGRNINPILIIGIVRILEIFTIIAAVKPLEKSLVSIGLDLHTITGGLKKGLLWSAIFGLVTGLIFLILYFAGIDPLSLIQTKLPENKKEILIFLIIGCFIGPVAEELFFRGVLYSFFRRWGILAALIFTTIIFILAHHNKGTIPLTQAIGGILFAAAYEFEKSLMVPIVIHILGNTAIFMLSFLW